MITLNVQNCYVMVKEGSMVEISFGVPHLLWQPKMAIPGWRHFFSKEAQIGHGLIHLVTRPYITLQVLDGWIA